MFGRSEHYIYGLKKAGSEDIFYVGMTGRMKDRLKDHKTTYGKDTEMVMLDYVHEKHTDEVWPARKVENWWIEFVKKCGHPVQNSVPVFGKKRKTP